MKRKTLGNLIAREPVLCAALGLAVLSCFFVPPDSGYLSYLDCRTLALLFCLMAVMAGLRAQQVFLFIAGALLAKAKNIRQLVMTLSALCFFSSMLITNDVALITFVPLTFVELTLCGADARARWAVPIVCLQTLAANLGSMLTPIGNPQNLYLYAKSGLTFPAFIKLMLPYTGAALLLLAGWIFYLCRKKAPLAAGQIAIARQTDSAPDRKKIALHLALFLVCLLSVLHLLAYEVMLGIVLGALLLFDRRVLAKVDYRLLLTFALFFVFIGNLSRMSAFSAWLQSALAGREVLIAVLSSQVVSNVPAALLLSGFTAQTEALIVGTNLGGLGTLIASMASLISYRQIANEAGDQKGAYFRLFTISNVVFLLAELGVWRLVTAFS